MVWQVQSGRPKVIITINETIDSNQRWYIQLLCLPEWAWKMFTTNIFRYESFPDPWVCPP